MQHLSITTSHQHCVSQLEYFKVDGDANVNTVWFSFKGGAQNRTMLHVVSEVIHQMTDERMAMGFFHQHHCL